MKPGDILAGKYRVDRVIGVGGMGVVVAATHLDLQEERAIKFMLPTALDDAEAVNRFLREARAASRLKSEHVARVHDVGRLDTGSPYMVMECLHGTDLSSRLKQDGPLPFADAIVYVLQAAEALAEAHAGGIVHRDLKPANLFLALQADGSTTVKVLDFGISKAPGPAAGEPDLTRTDVVLGSPHYMAPEQMQSSRDVDARADLWSMGVILYQLVTGKLPFRGAGLTEVIAQVLQGAAAPPSQVQPGVPPALDAVIGRCLERDPARRYQSVVELAQALAPLVPTVGPFFLERIQLIAAATPAGFLRATGNMLPLVPHPPTPLSTRSAPSGAWGATTAGAAPARSHLLAAGLGGGVVALVIGGAVAAYFAFTRPVPPPPSVAPAASAVPPPSAAPEATAHAPSASANAAPAPSASAPPAPSASTAAPAAAPPARKGQLRHADPFGASRK